MDPSSNQEFLLSGIFQSFTNTISNYLKEWLQAEGKTKPPRQIKDLAEAILEELDGSLLFFFFTEHSESVTAYTERHLTRLRQRLFDFLNNQS